MALYTSSLPRGAAVEDMDEEINGVCHSGNMCSSWSKPSRAKSGTPRAMKLSVSWSRLCMCS